MNHIIRYDLATEVKKSWKREEILTVRFGVARHTTEYVEQPMSEYTAYRIICDNEDNQMILCNIQ